MTVVVVFVGDEYHSFVWSVGVTRDCDSAGLSESYSVQDNGLLTVYLIDILVVKSDNDKSFYTVACFFSNLFIKNRGVPL